MKFTVYGQIDDDQSHLTITTLRDEFDNYWTLVATAAGTDRLCSPQGTVIELSYGPTPDELEQAVTDALLEHFG